RLLHELNVHRTELEMQNEELKRARHETEAALAGYTELFDFAPIGYATLTTGGKILEVNFAGARLLGQERSLLVSSSFAGFVASDHMSSFHALLQQASDDPGKNQRGELELLARGNRRLNARVSVATVGQTGRTIVVAFEDITEQKLREEKLAETERSLRD